MIVFSAAASSHEHYKTNPCFASYRLTGKKNRPGRREGLTVPDDKYFVNDRMIWVLSRRDNWFVDIVQF